MTAVNETTNPQLLRSAVTATHVAGTATQVSIQARQHGFTVDEPPALGGDDTGANPVEHLLAALGSCQVITYQVWAQKLGVQIGELSIELAGDIDLRGFLGEDDSVRPGFQNITVEVTLTGPETPQRYAELHETVERHCPVLDNLTTGVPVTSTVNLA